MHLLKSIFADAYNSDPPAPLSVLKEIIYISCSSLSKRRGQTPHSVIRRQQSPAQAGLSGTFCISPLLLLPTELALRAVRIPHCWELSHTGLHSDFSHPCFLLFDEVTRS